MRRGKNFFRPGACGWVLLSVAWAMCGVVQAAEQWSVSRLMAQLGKTQARQYAYVEKKYVSFLKKPKISRGTLVYRAPATLEKNMAFPKQNRYRIVDNKLYIQKQGKQERQVQLHNYPELLILSESLVATFSGKQQVLEKYYQITLEGDRTAWKLVLKPTNAELAEQIKRVEIYGNDRALQRVVIKEQDGDKSDLTITAQ